MLIVLALPLWLALLLGMRITADDDGPLLLLVVAAVAAGCS